MGEAEARMRACSLDELGPSRCEESIGRAGRPRREEVTAMKAKEKQEQTSWRDKEVNLRRH